MGLVPIFTCQVFDGWCEKDRAQMQHLNFSATTDKGSTTTVSLPHNVIQVGGAGLLEALAKQGVRAHPPGERYLKEFLMAWMTQINEAVASQSALPFGWYMDGSANVGFVYGGKVYRSDGTETKSGYGDTVMRSFFTPKGSIDPWFAACKLITNQKRPELEVITCAGFAGPLMKMNGQYCPLLSAWGSEGGGGKSTAVYVGLAIWGHPKLLKENSSTTPKSIMEKLGQLNNLPLFYDDIRDVEGQHNVLKVVFGSEGVGGGRLNSNITQRDRSEWQTMVVICSNMSFQDHVFSVYKTTQAAALRVFEYGPVEVSGNDAPGKINSIDATRLTQALETNFGKMGERYAKLLGSQPDKIQKLVDDISKDFQIAVGYKQEERFWIATCGTILAGATLANMLGCEFHIPEMRTFLIEKYLDLRKLIFSANVKGGGQDNTREILTGFLKYATGHQLYTNACPSGPGKPTQLISVLNDDDIDPRRSGGLYVQWVTQDRLLRISKAALAAYMVKNEIPPAAVFNGLEKHYGAVNKKLMRLGAGTKYGTPPEQIIHIHIPPGHELEPQLFAHGPVEAAKAVTATVTEGPSQASVDARSVLDQAIAAAAKDLETVRKQNP